MVTPRDTLKYLLYSRPNLPCLHDRETIQFSLGIGYQSPLLTQLFIFIVTRSENEYNCFHSLSLIPGLVNAGSGRNCVICCTLLKVYTTSSRTLPTCSRLLPTHWHCNSVFWKELPILSDQLPFDGEHGETGGVHDHGPTVALFWLWRDFLDQKQCCVEYHDAG